MKTGKYLIIVGLIVWISGCYTQFATLQDRDSRSRDDIVDDSTREVSKETVVRERENCYWHRTFFGDWELRCYETNYSDYWYSYYNRPWWYYHSSYYWYDCSCPYHLSYHPGCDYCWYYCNRYHHVYIHHIYDTVGTSTGTGTNVGVGKKQSRPPLRPGKSEGIGSSAGTVPTVSPKKKVVEIEEIGVETETQKKQEKIPVAVPEIGKQRPVKQLPSEEKKNAMLPDVGKKKVIQKEKKVQNNTNKADMNSGALKKDNKENTEKEKKWQRKRRPLRKKK